MLDWLDIARNQAEERFRSLPAPTTKDENFRFSPLSLELPPGSAAAGAGAAPVGLSALDEEEAALLTLQGEEAALLGETDGVLFTDLYRAALMGAEALFYPTAIGSEPHDPTLITTKPWQRAMQGHAVSNVIPVIGEVPCRQLTRNDFQQILDQAKTPSVAQHLKRCLTGLVNAGLEEGHLLARQDLLRGVRWLQDDIADDEPFDRAITEVLGLAPDYVVSPGTYDQKHIDRIGRLHDCIAYGPGILDLAHQPDEYVGIDDMLDSAKVMALALADLLHVQ